MDVQIYNWILIALFVLAVVWVIKNPAAVGGTIRGLIGLAVIGYAVFRIAMPFLTNQQTIVGIHADQIHGKSIGFAEAMSDQLGQKYQVAMKNRNNMSPQELLLAQGVLTKEQAILGRQQADIEEEADATLRGISRGDFYVSAKTPTFVDVGKKVCRGQWLEAWGEMDPRPGNDNYGHRVEAIGQDPLTNAYGSFQKLSEAAPLGALLVSFGDRYQFDWQPMGQGHYMLTPEVEGCQYIRAVVNDWVRGAEPTFRNFHAENTGGYSVKIHQD
jgi:hypothetical protein